jgi:translation initiation factor 2B subunit (eIF-2B alpha/beta/delta family)
MKFQFSKEEAALYFFLSITSMEQSLKSVKKEQETILKNANKLQHRQDKSKKAIDQSSKKKIFFFDL